MKVAMLFILQFVLCFCYAQNKKAVALNDRATSSSRPYFDCNDPHFLEDFINDQSGSKRKLFDSLIKKTPYYTVIPKDSLAFFIDSFANVFLADTGKVCQAINPNIRNQKALKPKSSFIVWINKKAFYRIGFHARNTLEFIDEFWDVSKIQGIAIVVPPKANYCMGKTIAHVYITTKRKAKLNFFVAGFEKKQMKIGTRWVGSNE